MATVASNADTSRWESAPRPVLILCADEGITEELIRDLAGRRYQPLVGRPGWSSLAALQWARPVAAVVDTRHPAVRSDGFLAATDDLEVGLVVFGRPADVPAVPRRGSHQALTRVATTEATAIGTAVDAAIRNLMA